MEHSVPGFPANFCNHFKCSRVRLDENSSEWNERENPWQLECWCSLARKSRRLGNWYRFVPSMKIGYRSTLVANNRIGLSRELIRKILCVIRELSFRFFFFFYFRRSNIVWKIYQIFLNYVFVIVSWNCKNQLYN